MYNKVFCPPPRVCSAPGAESNSAGGQKKFGALRAQLCSPGPTFFSAHAKINAVHATVTGIIETVTYKGFFRTTFCYDLKCNMDIKV